MVVHTTSDPIFLAPENRKREPVVLDVANNDSKAMRPKSLGEFMGQSHAKPNLVVYIQSSKQRKEALDHVLLSGPAGLGKTSLSEVIAAELGTKLHEVFGPSIKTVQDMVRILGRLKAGEVLFIDEIHALDAKVEEILYPAMEDQMLRFTSNNTPINIKMAPFTLIGATTTAGALRKPMRDRFGIKIEMQPYTDEELSSIILVNARKMGVAATQDGALELARRARGVPRTANALLRRVRDFVQCSDTRVMNAAMVVESCEKLGIDKAGLDISMRKYMGILRSKGTPVAIKTMVAMLGETEETVETVIEPHLMGIGFIEKTGRGRTLTASGQAHIA